MDASHMDPAAAERWAAAEVLLHEVLERHPVERARFLDGACRDAESRREIEALLDAHERRGKLDALACIRSVRAFSGNRRQCFRQRFHSRARREPFSRGFPPM